MSEGEERAAPGVRGGVPGELHAILGAIPGFVLRLRPDGTILFINRIPGEIERSQVLGSSVYSWITASSRATAQAAIARALETGQTQRYESSRDWDDGRTSYHLNYVSPIHDADGPSVVLVSFDHTELHEREQTLRYAQKMEAVGQLTAGIAHNFNNMLSVILPTLQHVERMVPEERRSLVRSAQEAASRAADLVRKMVRFAREPSSGTRSPTPIEELVRRAVEICQRVFDPAIELREVSEASGVLVHVSSSDIEQTLVNLLINARDAVTNVPSPQIRVEVMTEGEWALVRISDNGAGMAEPVQARIFEPFFTTKGSGRGTGLGLATAYVTLREHGGSISCESAPRRGSSFTVRLPVWRGAVPELAEPAVAREPAPVEGKRVLVVDDEEAIRRALGWLLDGAGYDALFAGSTAEALAQLRRVGEVALVLVDRSMPGGLSADDLRQMRALVPGVRLLLHTGHEPPSELAALVDGVLLKPASRESVLERIAAALREG